MLHITAEKESGEGKRRRKAERKAEEWKAEKERGEGKRRRKAEKERGGMESGEAYRTKA